MSPIGKADHDIVYIEYDIKIKRIQQVSRKIYFYKRADIDGRHDHLARFRDSFLSSDYSQLSINDLWVSLKFGVIAAIEMFIPTKMTETNRSIVRSSASYENATNFTLVLASQAALTLRAITNGSEHMFKRSLEKHIGNIFLISSF